MVTNGPRVLITSGLTHKADLRTPSPVIRSLFLSKNWLSAKRLPQCCINNMEKDRQIKGIIMKIAKFSTIFWMSRMVNSKNGAVFLILFTFQESWRTSDPVLSRDCGSRLQLHPWRLGSEALQLLQRWGLRSPFLHFFLIAERDISSQFRIYTKLFWRRPFCCRLPLKFSVYGVT